MQHGIRTIAFPAISTGAYRFPLERATRIALAEVERVLASDDGTDKIEKVVFVCFDRRTLRCYSGYLRDG